MGAEEFINYFKNFKSIEDYLRFTKEEQCSVGVQSIVSLKMSSLMKMFIQRTWTLILSLLEIDSTISSSSILSLTFNCNIISIIEKNIPGRELRWIVYEKNSKRLWDSFVLDLQLSILNHAMNG